MQKSKSISDADKNYLALNRLPGLIVEVTKLNSVGKCFLWNWKSYRSRDVPVGLSTIRYTGTLSQAR